MSRCPRNPDCNAKRDPPFTANCRTTCPGLKKSCPVENSCPAPKSPNAPCTDQDNCTQTQQSIIRVTTSCVPTAGCSQPSTVCPPPLSGCVQPIIIQAPKEQNGGKTDLRIELYIHQLPPDQNGTKNGPSAGSTDPRGSIGSGGAKTDTNASGVVVPGAGTTGRASVGGANDAPDGNAVDGLVEENIGVKKAGQLESAPPKSAKGALGPGSDIGPNKLGKVNMSTDTDEDQRASISQSGGGNMVDEATQA